jgi:5-methylcytosine-specific restriction endonuclease McrA
VTTRTERAARFVAGCPSTNQLRTRLWYPASPSTEASVSYNTCVKCRVLVLLGTSHCSAHKPKRKPHAHSAAARGYDWQWRKLAAEAIAAQPWCTYCNHTGSAANPLTGDHIVPLSRGGQSTADNLQVLCKRCNGAKRDRTR